MPKAAGRTSISLEVAKLDYSDSLPSSREENESRQAIPERAHPSPPPTLRVLYSSLSASHMPLGLFAAALSLSSGCLAPLMTRILGHIFDSYTAYNRAALPNDAISENNKDILMRAMGRNVGHLALLGAAVMLLNTAMISAWIVLGEKLTTILRTQIYTSVSSNDMAWFDLGMGCASDSERNHEATSDDDEGGYGAGGLMAKFVRETDDVRVAITQTSGQLLQHVVTCVASLVLALVTCWKLALVILATIPFTIVAAGVVERVTAPLLAGEREHTAYASSLVERVANAISTIKAYGAEFTESSRFSAHLHKGSKAYNRVTYAWGARLGITSFLLFSMFVQGFWYGSRLVQQGSITPGVVLTVFSACLLASNHLQMVILNLSLLEKGKSAAASLCRLTQRKGDNAPSFSGRSRDNVPAKMIPRLEDVPSSPSESWKSSRKERLRPMRRIRPKSRCYGEVTLRNITFTYPSAKRQTQDLRRDTLSGVNLFIPAGEPTFLVGGSGSGKSTIAQLILQLYQPDFGRIELDEQDIRFLDPDWCRRHIASVDQQPIIFDMSIHDNVALGFSHITSGAELRELENIPQVSREQVIDACRLALMHDFIVGLPDGYDTILGAQGQSLSGGQRQRLAIARARLRDPTVLILDESTSALDTTSRLLINEAVKTWRKGKTTLIITHDLTQVSDDDFVYIMKDGVVTQHGYWGQLDHGDRTECVEKGAEGIEMPREASWRSSAPFKGCTTRLSSQRGLSQPYQPGFKHVGHPQSRQDGRTYSYSSDRTILSDFTDNLRVRGQDRTGSKGLLTLRLAEQQHFWQAQEAPWLEHSGLVAAHARDVPQSGAKSDTKTPVVRRVWRDEELESIVSRRFIADNRAGTDAGKNMQVAIDTADFAETIAFALRTIPSKPVFIGGLTCSLIGGGVTPVFSYFLGKLLATMGLENQSRNVLVFSLIVFGLAVLEGAFAFARFTLLELVGDQWIQTLRRSAFDKVLKQDKTWFDIDSNAKAGTLVTRIVKDAEDARNLICRSIGSLLVVMAMVLAGLIWAMIIGWQLTLVGLAVGPLFVAATTVQSRLISRFEARNKLRRETVGQRFYDLISNIRGIRSMALEPVFASRFAEALRATERDALYAAPFSGLGFGLGEGLTYLSEALLFYVGALFIVRGLYDFERLILVFNLFIFAVTFAAETMAFLPGLSKSIEATDALRKLVELRDDKSSEGCLSNCSNAPLLKGKSFVTFHNVHFAFPSRPDSLVLSGISFTVEYGEKVAIVGRSGCGKSTVAAMMQRLYEPMDIPGGYESSYIALGGSPISTLPVKVLRRRMAIIGQSADLFDMSVAENIKFGHSDFDPDGSNRIALACTLAQAASFIGSLPKGYQSALGESASLLSGGQRQRLAIARGLYRVLPGATSAATTSHLRSADLLIMDEATSALDDDTRARVLDILLPRRGDQHEYTRSSICEDLAHTANMPADRATALVSEAISRLRTDVTMLMITHKLDEMKRCDRIVVLDDGRVVQQGTYAELISVRGGIFASLASAGEWTGE